MIIPYIWKIKNGNQTTNQIVCDNILGCLKMLASPGVARFVREVPDWTLDTSISNSMSWGRGNIQGPPRYVNVGL